MDIMPTNSSRPATGKWRSFLPDINDLHSASLQSSWQQATGVLMISPTRSSLGFRSRATARLSTSLSLKIPTTFFRT